MPDWKTILAPSALGLPADLVRETVPLVREDRDGDPFMEVRVELAPAIGVDSLSWDLLGPVQQAIIDRVDQEAGAGYVWVRFFTAEDWATLDESDFAEVADDAAT